MRWDTILDEFEDVIDGQAAELYCRHCKKKFVSRKRSFSNVEWSPLTCSAECYALHVEAVRKGAAERRQTFLQKLSPEQRKAYENAPLPKPVYREEE